ncbi:patatin-like phospholipase family protein [Aureimonas psammosilenae]|uniref:patatin-like phospholipase family protein n=1 Tax=Aureimonas psammosilenae TaxID=2495496 RepID=UPI00186A6456|nr:patatin-like phospholipase family protein [Aureimonas psammosilenae]
MRGEGLEAGRDFDLVLILSGGNALGAFQAGVYEALHEAGLEPDWIVGTSIGAINGALIAGTEPARRVEALRAFWRSPFDGGFGWTFASDTFRRTAAANWTVAVGRSGLFGPVLSGTAGPAIYETQQLRRTLLASVDFDRLNTGGCRYTATAVDLESGEDVAFDSAERRVEADHVRASAALPVLFPPVEIDGRWMVDGGVSANLALDPFFVTPPVRATFCIAVDLLPLAQRRPRTIGEAGSRMQDLLFAAQSRHALARWRDAYASHGEPGITFAKLTYARQEDEIVGKALDYSATTLETRWQRGRDEAESLLQAIRDGKLPLRGPGLRIHEG